MVFFFFLIHTSTKTINVLASSSLALVLISFLCFCASKTTLLDTQKKKTFKPLSFLFSNWFPRMAMPRSNVENNKFNAFVIKKKRENNIIEPRRTGGVRFRFGCQLCLSKPEKDTKRDESYRAIACWGNRLSPSFLRSFLLYLFSFPTPMTRESACVCTV